LTASPATRVHVTVVNHVRAESCSVKESGSPGRIEYPEFHLPG
jgi:hypothetical protein